MARKVPAGEQKKCEQTSKKVLLSARDVLVGKQKNCKPASTKAGRVLTRMQVSKQDKCRRAGKRNVERQVGSWVSLVSCTGKLGSFRGQGIKFAVSTHG